LQEVQSTLDQAVQSDQNARDELLEAQKGCKQALEREEMTRAELLKAHTQRGETFRSKNKINAELLETMDTARIHNQTSRKHELAAELAQRATVSMEAEMQEQVQHAKDSAAKEIAAHLARLTAVSGVLEKLQKQNVQMEEELVAAQLTAARAPRESALLQSSLTDLTELRHWRENELMGKAEELRKLQRKTAGHAAMSDSIDKLCRQNVELDKESGVLRLKAEGASSEARMLQSSVTDLMHTRQQLEQKLASKNEELFKLDHEKAALTIERKGSQAKREASDRYRKEQQNTIQTLTAELEAAGAQSRLPPTHTQIPSRMPPQAADVLDKARQDDSVEILKVQIEQ